jgi:hypothetical protein
MELLHINDDQRAQTCLSEMGNMSFPDTSGTRTAYFMMPLQVWQTPAHDTRSLRVGHRLSDTSILTNSSRRSSGAAATRSSDPSSPTAPWPQLQWNRLHFSAIRTGPIQNFRLCSSTALLWVYNERAPTYCKVNAKNHGCQKLMQAIISNS